MNGNNSTDGTGLIANESGVIDEYEHQQGKGNIIRIMFFEIDAECYLLVDGDDTYHDEAASDLVDKILEDRAIW